MDTEGVYAEEAQEEALLSRSRSIESHNGQRISIRTAIQDEDVSENETSPLMRSRSNLRQRITGARDDENDEEPEPAPIRHTHDFSHLPWHKKPSIWWLLPAFFPFCIAFGGIIVPKTYLILDLICRRYLEQRAALDPTFHFLPVVLGEDNPQCRDPNVQSMVAQFNLYQSLLSGIFAAIVTPHLGAWSDRIGRKKVMVLVSFGGFVNEVITIVVGVNPDTVSVYWLLLGALADGLCGSFTAGMAITFAYASDCTPPDRRNIAFGFFHGTMFTGIALGPILAGWLIKVTGTVLTVFYVALGCHVFFIVFLVLLTPESLSKERQMEAREKRKLAKAEAKKKASLDERMSETSSQLDRGQNHSSIIPKQISSATAKVFSAIKSYNLFGPLWVLWPVGEGTSSKLRRNLVVLASIDTMMFGVAMGTMQIIIIYAEFRFGWDAFKSSIYMSIVNICRVTTLVVALPLLTRWFRSRTSGEQSTHHGCDMLDINIIRVSTVFDLVGYLGYAFAPSGVVMLLSGMVASIGGVGPPTLQSSLTKHIPEDKTGQILGASGLLHALARVVAPTIFNLIYSQTVGIYAGIVFICLASVFVIVFCISWLLRPNVYLVDTRSKDLNLDETTLLDEAQQS